MERKDVLMDAIKKMELLLLALSKKVTHNQAPSFVAEVFSSELGLDLFSTDMEEFSKQVEGLKGMDQNNLLSVIALMQNMQGSSVNSSFDLGQKIQLLKHILHQKYKVFVF